MQRPHLATLLLLVGLLALLGRQASATTGMSFDDQPPPVLNVSTDSANPTVLNRLTVVCPAAGFLVATGTATAFMRNVNSITSTASEVFSIAREVKSDDAFRTVVVQTLGPNTFVDIPASLQRVDACHAGDTVTYFHVVHGSGGPAPIQVTTESRSRLIVEFFDQPL